MQNSKKYIYKINENKKMLQKRMKKQILTELIIYNYSKFKTFP